MSSIFSIIKIIDLYHLIRNIFKKKNTENGSGSQDRFCTPPRAQSRLRNKNIRDANVRGRRTNSYPTCLPSRLPKSFPLTRYPSQISLLGSSANRSTPFRPNGITRSRGSISNLQGAVNEAFDSNFPEIRRTNARREGLILGSRDIPSNRSSNSSFDFHPAVEDRLNMPSNDMMDYENSFTTKKSKFANNNLVPGAPTSMHNYNLRNADVRSRRLNSDSKCLSSRSLESYTTMRTPSQVSLLDSNSSRLTPFSAGGITRLEGSNTNLQSSSIRRDELAHDFREASAYKDSNSSFEFHPAVEDQVDMQLNDSLECCNDLTMRNLQLRNNSHSTPGCPHPYKHVCSKIPIRHLGRHVTPKPEEFINFPEHFRGRYTLTASKRNSYGRPDFQENENITDTEGLRTNDISNWITFRNDTSKKFERVFKSLSKKKHHSTGNIIDASSHVQWMKLSGVGVDQDATMFKKFAGGKVVLTFGEYKFLIHKICIAHDLDYWDVMRNMATFEKDLHLEDSVFH